MSPEFEVPRVAGEFGLRSRYEAARRALVIAPAGSGDERVALLEFMDVAHAMALLLDEPQQTDQRTLQFNMRTRMNALLQLDKVERELSVLGRTIKALR